MRIMRKATVKLPRETKIAITKDFIHGAKNIELARAYRLSYYVVEITVHRTLREASFNVGNEINLVGRNWRKLASMARKDKEIWLMAIEKLM